MCGEMLGVISWRFEDVVFSLLDVSCLPRPHGYLRRTSSNAYVASSMRSLVCEVAWADKMESPPSSVMLYLMTRTFYWGLGSVPVRLVLP